MRRIILFLLLAIVSGSAATARTRLIGDRLWGFSVSYSVKWYTHTYGGRHHFCNFFGQSGPLQGIRFGIPVEMTLWKGLGFSSGVFGEVYSCKNHEDTQRIEQVGMYFPFHAMYRFEIGKSMSLSVATGPALTVGMLQRIIDPTNSLNKGYNLQFNNGTPHRTDCLWEAAVIFGFKMFRFSAVYSAGLTPSHRFLSLMGAGDTYVSTNTQGFSVNFGLQF